MNAKVNVALAIAWLLPVFAHAAIMSSPNYNLNNASVISGGGSTSSSSGTSGSGMAIGQALYMPADITSVSPNYSVKQVAQVAPGGGGGYLHTGDINGDGVVDIVDALLALKAGAGLMSLSPVELTRGDVGPLVLGVPVGNGTVDIEDTMLILRKATGLGW